METPISERQNGVRSHSVRKSKQRENADTRLRDDQCTVNVSKDEAIIEQRHINTLGIFSVFNYEYY